MAEGRGQRTATSPMAADLTARRSISNTGTTRRARNGYGAWPMGARCSNRSQEPGWPENPGGDRNHLLQRTARRFIPGGRRGDARAHLWTHRLRGKISGGRRFSSAATSMHQDIIIENPELKDGVRHRIARDRIGDRTTASRTMEACCVVAQNDACRSSTLTAWPGLGAIFSTPGWRRAPFERSLDWNMRELERSTPVSFGRQFAGLSGVISDSGVDPDEKPGETRGTGLSIGQSPGFRWTLNPGYEVRAGKLRNQRGAHTGTGPCVWGALRCWRENPPLPVVGLSGWTLTRRRRTVR